MPNCFVAPLSSVYKIIFLLNIIKRTWNSVLYTKSAADVVADSMCSHPLAIWDQHPIRWLQFQLVVVVYSIDHNACKQVFTSIRRWCLAHQGGIDNRQIDVSKAILDCCSNTECNVLRMYNVLTVASTLSWAVTNARSVINKLAKFHLFLICVTDMVKY